MSIEKDILSGRICQDCNKVFKENCDLDKCGEYIVESPGHARPCEKCRDAKVDKIIDAKKKEDQDRLMKRSAQLDKMIEKAINHMK